MNWLGKTMVAIVAGTGMLLVVGSMVTILNGGYVPTEIRLLAVALVIISSPLILIALEVENG